MLSIQEFMVGFYLRVVGETRRFWEKISPKLAESRGDVPGWVMITLMTSA